MCICVNARVYTYMCIQCVCVCAVVDKGFLERGFLLYACKKEICRPCLLNN